MAGTRRGSNVGNALSVNRNVSVFLLLLRRILFSKQTFSPSSSVLCRKFRIFPLFQNRGAVAVGAGSSTSCCVLLAAAAAAAQRPPFPMDVSTETPIWVWIALLFDSSLFTSKI